MGKHYIPQEYLRGFAHPDRPDHIWMYDRQERSWSCPAIKKAAQQRGYYTEEAEQWLRAAIEDPAHSVLNRLRAGDGFSPDDRVPLAVYMAVLHTRVPKQHKKQMDAAPLMLPSTIERVRGELTDSLAEADPARLITLLAEIDRLEAAYSHKLPDDFVRRLRTPRASHEVVEILLKMTWRLAPSRPPHRYLTTDAPLFFFEQYGVGTLRAEITFPISPELALFGSHQGPPGVTLMRRPLSPLVKEANRRLVSAAHRFIFSPTKTAWIERVASKASPHLTPIKW